MDHFDSIYVRDQCDSVFLQVNCLLTVEESMDFTNGCKKVASVYLVSSCHNYYLGVEGTMDEVLNS